MRILHYKIRRERVILQLLDGGALVIAIAIAFRWRLGELAWPDLRGYFVALAAIAACLFLLLDWSGAYESHADFAHPSNILRFAGALLVPFVITAFFGYLWPGRGIGGRGVAVLVIGISAVLIVCGRVAYGRVAVSDAFIRRTIVLGTGTMPREIVARLRADRSERRPVGVVDDQGPSELVPWLGPVEAAEEVFTTELADCLVLAFPGAVPPAISESILRLLVRHPQLELLDAPALMEEITGRLPLSQISPQWILASLASYRCRFYLRFGKRWLDLAAGSVLLLLASPVLALGVAAILCERSGPVLFQQDRVGAHERTFRIFKLRTMGADAEKHGPVWSGRNDARVTRAGRLLRRFRMDEIPQLWNVLRGDMSLVGPRPERPEFVRQLAANLRHYHLRHIVAAGLTGWAQINHSYANSLDTTATKLEYDLYYLKNASFSLDLYILLRTVRTVAMGARMPLAAPPEAVAAAAASSTVGTGGEKPQISPS